MLKVIEIPAALFLRRLYERLFAAASSSVEIAGGGKKSHSHLFGNNLEDKSYVLAADEIAVEAELVLDLGFKKARVNEHQWAIVVVIEIYYASVFIKFVVLPVRSVHRVEKFERHCDYVGPVVVLLKEWVYFTEDGARKFVVTVEEVDIFPRGNFHSRVARGGYASVFLVNDLEIRIFFCIPVANCARAVG